MPGIHDLINFSVSRDDDGTYLRGSLCVGEQCFAHEVKLDPIIDALKRTMVRAHGKLHGDTVAGIGDWYRSVEGVAKRIAASKVAQVVISQVKAHQKDIIKGAAGLVPGGSSLADAAYAISDTVSSARDGDQVAKAKLVAIVGLAAKGDASAKGVVALAKKINDKLVEKSGDPVAVTAHEAYHKARKRSAYLDGAVVGRTTDQRGKAPAGGGGGIRPGGLFGAGPVGPGSKPASKPGSRGSFQLPTNRVDRFGNPIDPSAIAQVLAQPRAPAVTPSGTPDGVVMPGSPYGGMPGGSPYTPPYAPQQPQPYQDPYANQYGGGYQPDPYAGQYGGGDPSGYGYGGAPPMDPGQYGSGDPTGGLTPDDQGGFYDQYGGYLDAQGQYYPPDGSQYGGGDPTQDPSYVASNYTPGRDHRTNVSGWGYNRPYRTLADHLVAIEKSPGVGLGLREIYNRGLGKGKTTRDSIIQRALRGNATALAAYQALAPYAAQLGI